MNNNTNFDDECVASALYHAALGKLILNYVDRLHPAVIQDTMERRAVQTLEAIRCVLENGALDDASCCERIENLIRLFYQELGIQIHRHDEVG